MSKTYSSADRVYDEVKESILAGDLPGGELISEGEIAQRCEVSRTPVREAFLRLATEGWMRLYPKRGALIVPVGDQEAREVIEARLLVESQAVRRIVAAGSQERVGQALTANIAAHRLVSPSDMSEFARLDAEFHRTIVLGGGNGLLVDFYTSLGERQRRMTTASVHRDIAVAESIFADHSALAGAIADGDTEHFENLLHDHLTRVHEIPGAAR